MKKLSAILLGALLALGMLVGCGTSADPQDVVGTDDYDPNKEYTIEFFGWGSAEEQKNYQILVDAFMEEYQNITVLYSATDPQSYMTTLTNRANSLPDVFYMPDQQFSAWAHSGRLLNIKNLISQEKLDTIWKEGVDRYRYNRTTASYGDSEGAGLYGLPKDLGPFTLVYNKNKLAELAAAKGVSQDLLAKVKPEVPMTWDEFRALLKAIDTDPNDSLFGVSHYELQSAIYSNNTDFFKDNYTKSNLEDPRVAEAVQFIADLCLVDHVMPTAAQQQATNGFQRFSNGDAVFSFVGPWDLSGWWETLAFDFDIIPVPYGRAEGARSTSYVGSMAFSLSAKTPNVGASLRLIEFLSLGERSQRMNYELGQAIPNIVDMAKDEYVNNTKGLLTGRKASPASRQVFIDIAEGFTDENDKIGGRARAVYYTYTNDWYTDFTDGLRDVWNGKTTAAEYCKAYSETFQAQLDDMFFQYK